MGGEGEELRTTTTTIVVVISAGGSIPFFCCIEIALQLYGRHFLVCEEIIVIFSRRGHCLVVDVLRD